MNIEIDHLNGKNYINGHEFGIIYPDSFFKKSKKFLASEKKYLFYFNGFIDSEGGRNLLFQNYLYDQRGLIINSDKGRKNFRKAIYNKNYFSELSTSVFGLCPIHVNWPGSWHTAWTYRFIECCLVGAIPAVFTKTPHSKTFTQDFFSINEEKLLESNFSQEELSKYAWLNFLTAQKKFCLPQP